MSAGMIVLTVLNGVFSLIGVGFAVASAVRPSAMSREANPTAGEHLYARVYAARAVPLGILAGAVPFFPHSTVGALVLVVAAIAQAADAAIGAQRREPAMVAGPLFACIVHTITAIAIF
ncbi:hypothetical protein KO481_29125 [Nocardia sp. NEAU-G5]|uniref:DUF4267 domain-containing protein n=1 Tax=Nocardia albiluteola TaxID=2842303 RepID=A0ABS6AX40_9NOCA|nr:hypothetical protein [Nocardia albiluteola]MBU3062589.1 hypothetical protein [Nocardia albiluteola]MBU3065577.1 hypothetical protein [Nocardia albiluteola]